MQHTTKQKEAACGPQLHSLARARQASGYINIMGESLLLLGTCSDCSGSGAHGAQRRCVWFSFTRSYLRAGLCGEGRTDKTPASSRQETTKN